MLGELLTRSKNTKVSSAVRIVLTPSLNLHLNVNAVFQQLEVWFPEMSCTEAEEYTMECNMARAEVQLW